MAEPAPRVLVVGEALIDIVHSSQGAVSEHVGGSPANVAVGLARLGHSTTLATHLGPDEHGARIAAYLQERDVRLSPGSDSAVRTPTATARLDAEGVARYDFDLTWELPELELTGTGHLHTGSIAATLEPGGSDVLELLRHAREVATTSYDPNLRPSMMGAPHQVRSRIEECIGLADVVKASAEDLQWLYAGAPVAEVARLWGLLG
ncbi:MAG: PfkB family carbohydrate kinase, partial [Actinomycetota bacterium]|nr:PfkB family carbohydrate kinase [Actinomycetota bacterium]